MIVIAASDGSVCKSACFGFCVRLAVIIINDLHHLRGHGCCESNKPFSLQFSFLTSASISCGPWELIKLFTLNATSAYKSGYPL